jgi:hypothetical protein
MFILRRWPVGYPGATQLESKTRHLRRFLGNENIDPERFYSPVFGRLIERAVQGAETQGSGPIRLLVDTVELSEERQVLMAGIAYRRRALPICWETYRRERTDEKESRTLNSKYPCSKHLRAGFPTKQRLWS